MQGYGNRYDHPYQVQYKLAVESVKVHQSSKVAMFIIPYTHQAKYSVSLLQ